MSSPSTYTVAIQFGHIIGLNDNVIFLHTIFTGTLKSEKLKQHAPDLAPELLRARTAISETMIEYARAMLRLGVPGASANPRPPDYLVLHLPLPLLLLQGIAEVATATAESFRQLDKMLPAPLPEPVRARLDHYRRSSSEVAGAWLQALATAGVPTEPAAR